MNFIKHSNLSGLHAPFSASSSAWLRYSDDKLLTVFENLKAKEIGTNRSFCSGDLCGFINRGIYYQEHNHFQKSAK